MYIPAGSTVLEWGCGNGHVSYGLSRLGYKVSGFSFDDFCLRKYLGTAYDFRQGSCDDPEMLPYSNDRFDGVTSVGVLEHVRETGGNEESSLSEIFRILRPGGYFICAIFRIGSAWLMRYPLWCRKGITTAIDIRLTPSS